MKERKKEKSMYFDKFNIKKYCDKKEFSNFLINAFNNLYMTKKFDFNI